MTHRHSGSGFTLVETLFAAAVLITAIAGVTQLFVLSIRFTRDSSRFGSALVAAQDKLETLRSLRYTYDDDGAMVTDPRLLPSPANSLLENTGNYFDWLDGDGPADAGGAVYVRRWRIVEIASDDPSAIAFEVCVFEPSAAHADTARAHGCLGSVRVRQP